MGTNAIVAVNPRTFFTLAFAALFARTADNSALRLRRFSREPLIIQPFGVAYLHHEKDTLFQGCLVVEISGFEPLASSLRTRRSTN